MKHNWNRDVMSDAAPTVTVPPLPSKLPDFLPFKCISCFEPAECLFSGRSYCRGCLERDRSTGRVI